MRENVQLLLKKVLQAVGAVISETKLRFPVKKVFNLPEAMSLAIRQ